MNIKKSTFVLLILFIGLSVLIAGTAGFFYFQYRQKKLEPPVSLQGKLFFVKNRNIWTSDIMGQNQKQLTNFTDELTMLSIEDVTADGKILFTDTTQEHKERLRKIREEDIATGFVGVPVVFYFFDLNSGRQIELSIPDFPNLLDVFWAPDNIDLVLIHEAPAEKGDILSLFNPITKEQRLIYKSLTGIGPIVRFQSNYLAFAEVEAATGYKPNYICEIVKVNILTGERTVLTSLLNHDIAFWPMDNENFVIAYDVYRGPETGIEESHLILINFESGEVKELLTDQFDTGGNRGTNYDSIYFSRNSDTLYFQQFQPLPIRKDGDIYERSLYSFDLRKKTLEKLTTSPYDFENIYEVSFPSNKYLIFDQFSEDGNLYMLDLSAKTKKLFIPVAHSLFLR